MNMNKRIGLVVFTGFLLLTALCASFWRIARKLEAENVTLRAEMQELSAGAQASPPEPQLEPRRDQGFELQLRELLSLRNEVAQLRSSRDAGRRAEEELARIRANSGRTLMAGGPAEGQSI